MQYSFPLLAPRHRFHAIGLLARVNLCHLNQPTTCTPLFKALLILERVCWTYNGSSQYNHPRPIGDLPKCYHCRYLLHDADGKLSKETARKVIDGSIFEELEKAHTAKLTHSSSGGDTGGDVISSRVHIENREAKTEQPAVSIEDDSYAISSYQNASSKSADKVNLDNPTLSVINRVAIHAVRVHDAGHTVRFACQTSAT